VAKTALPPNFQHGGIGANLIDKQGGEIYLHLMRFFGALAVIGFILSAIVHGLTLLGVDVEQRFPLVWLLHLGIFIVWIPTVILFRRNRASKKNDPSKWTTQGEPRWMRLAPGILFAYLCFNALFTYFVLKQDTTPGEVNGEKVLKDHGRVIRKLTDEEYHSRQAYEVRMFTGHWLLFYWVAASTLLPKSPQVKGRERIQSERAVLRAESKVRSLRGKDVRRSFHTRAETGGNNLGVRK
jgi:hypothetical protein